MDEYFDEPELAGYQPHSEHPLRKPHVVTAMRVIVVLALVGLLLPGILLTMATAERTATSSCSIYVQYYAPEATGFSARFELFSASGAGWNCYAISFGGGETLVASLGLIPGGPRIPALPSQPS